MTAARPYFIVRTPEEVMALTRSFRVHCIDNYAGLHTGVWFLTSQGVVNRVVKVSGFTTMHRFPIVPTNSISHFVASVRRWHKVPRP